MFLKGSWRATVMVGCKVPEQPNVNGSYDIETTDQVVYTVGDDGTLRCQGEWLIYAFSEAENGIYKIFRNTELVPVTEGASLVSRPAEFDFGDTYQGYTQSSPLFLANVGRAGGKLACEIPGDTGLSLTGSDADLAPMSCHSYSVSLKPYKAVPFRADIILGTEQEPGLLTIPVTAQVAENDLSKIVKEGDFQLSSDTYFANESTPFFVTDKCTGYPVAATGGQNVRYGLRADFDVP